MSNFPRDLLSDLMRGAPFQPATNLWRAVELTVLIEKGLSRIKEARAILDLGCGDGSIMKLLRPHLPSQASVSGIDLDPQETALALQSGIYAHVATGSAEKLPFDDASFDCVISNSVLEHIPPIDAVLAEVGRVLKPGGLLLATAPGADFHRALSGPIWPGVTRTAYLEDLDKRLAHEYYWSAPAWAEHLAHARLSLVDGIAYLDRNQTRRWELLSRLTGGALYFLFGRRQRPIQLQRAMGMRKPRLLPRPLARCLARLAAMGLEGRDPQKPYGCLLVVARREAEPHARKKDTL